MTRLSRSLLILAVLAPALAACGEGDGGGWVVQPVRGMVPYTEERTAGSGVAYVRAYMLPEKGPVLTPVAASAATPMTDAAPIFDSKQVKGAK